MTRAYDVEVFTRGAGRYGWSLRVGGMRAVCLLHYATAWSARVDADRHIQRGWLDADYIAWGAVARSERLSGEGSA